MGVVTWSATAIAKCKGGKRPEVFVKSKSAIRRGPGLNYAVTSFLEKGRCLRLSEVSMDEGWALVESTDLFGWVPVKRLAKSDRSKVAKIAPSRAPIGSGRTRGRVWTNRGAALRDTPQTTAPTRKVLQAGEPLIAIATTGDGVWVQVRDDRGEVGWVPATRIRDETGVLAGVPRTSKGVEVKTVTFTDREQVTERRTVLVPMRQGVLIDAQVLVSANLPQHSLNSNGQAAFRRYDINAVAAGLRLEAATTSLRPVHARFSYGFTFLTGVSPEGGESITGRHHEARIVAGYPIDLGALWVTPEVGYMFQNADIDPVLPGDPLESGGTFFSSRFHGGTFGLNMNVPVGTHISIDVEAAALVGGTQEYPLDLGEPKLSLGVVGGLGGRYALSDQMAIVGRWDFRYRSVAFEGGSFSDRTITEATLSNLDHGFFGGVMFAL